MTVSTGSVIGSTQAQKNNSIFEKSLEDSAKLSEIVFLLRQILMQLETLTEQKSEYL